MPAIVWWSSICSATVSPRGRLEADTSVAAQARILGRLLDKLSVGRVHVVGHDIGGAIAMIFAIGEPERVERLALIDTVSYDS